MNTKIKNTLLILLVAAFVLTGCAATMEDDFLPDTEALPFATPTPIPQLTLKDVPRPTPSPTPAPSPEQSEAPAATQKIITAEVQKLLWRNLQTWKEKQERPGFDGRLLIPAAGIDVGLFSSGYGEDVTQMRQNITDALDSALLYYDGVGFIIADHSNQDFASLPLVQKGDRAYILEGNSILTLSCSLVTDGVNTGEGIRDINGEYITDESLFTCYTCLEDWTHIQMVGFAMKDEDFIDIDWIDVGEANNNAGSTAGSATTTSTSANNGVATTISLPAPAPANTNTESGNAAAATPAPAASPAPATPTPTAAPAAPQPVQQAPVYDDYTIPGYDIYADADSTFGIYYSNGVDSYLG